MPLLHRSPPSSPRRPSTVATTTTTTTAPNQTSPKGVKRIVSGLKRRISTISLRGHRRSVSEESDFSESHLSPSPFILNIVPDDHHPIPLPLSPHPSGTDALTRSTSASGLGKHFSDSEDSSSTSSASHYRSSSTDSDQVESSSPVSVPGEIPPIEEEDRDVGDLSARLPPPEPLTAPLESSVPPSSEQTQSHPSFESLTAPLETILLAELESSSTLPIEGLTEEVCSVAESCNVPLPPLEPSEIPLPPPEPWEIPLPPLEPCEIPLPPPEPHEVPLPPLEPWDIPLPGEDEELEPEPVSIQAVPLSFGILAITAGLDEGAGDSYQFPLPPSLQLWDVPLSQEDLELPFTSEEQSECEPATSDSPHTLPMDPLGASTLDAQLSASMEVLRDTPLVSPPPPVGEPEVPNPFIEDPTMSSDESSADSEDDTTRTAEIALAPPAAVATPRSPDLNKPVPSTPVVAAVASDEEDEEDVPELYLPGLTLPTMFLPIPNTDPLSTLLTKYIPPEKRPPRDLTGDYARSGGEIHPLVMTNSWRAIARQARDRIVEADPEDVSYILSLWYLRLSSLARMRLFNQTTAECTNLFTVLHAIEAPEKRAFLFDRVLPFELEVLYAKLKYWAGDHMGYLDALAALLHRCKTKARAAKTDLAAAAMWTERGSRVSLIIASQLIEMKDYAAAAKILEPLCVQNGNVTSPALRSAVARVYLQGGYIAMAAQHLAAVAEDPTADPVQKIMNAALFASAEGDWQRAATELQKILATDPENFVAVNNLAVALLNQGRLQEGIEVLENALRTSPATIVTAEPFLFNLSTLYELKSAAGADKKRDLLIEVAKWAGDGLRTTCLKMPTN